MQKNPGRAPINVAGEDFPVVSVRGTAVGNVKDTNATTLFRLKTLQIQI